MGFDLNALAAKKAVTKVDYMGQSATVFYNPAVLTAENMTKARSGGDEGFVDVFTDLILDWDVKRANRKVPLTRKGLEGVPLPFLRAVFTTVLGGSAVQGDDEEGKASSDG